MNSVLVTGGAGFLGTHLCEYLLNNGSDVVCLDNFYTSSKQNLASFLENSNFKIIERDITESIEDIGSFDQIYNLACPASPVHYQSDPVKTIKTNMLGVLNLLELAKKTNARVLQASTSEVYGDPLQHPQKETYWGHVNPIGIRACYDEGKRIAETLMMEYYRRENVEVRIVRIFNTYGPRMLENDGRVVSNFICQALRGDDITIYGNGQQTRSFCYASDLIEGLVRMMNNPDFIGPVNLGNPKEFTVYELAEKIISLTKSSSKIVFHSLPQDDPKQRQPDISLAQKKLGWTPKVQLEQGLINTIDYFQAI